MAAKQEILNRIREACLVPVLRASSPEKAVRMARAAAEGGDICLVGNNLNQISINQVARRPRLHRVFHYLQFGAARAY